MFLCVFDERLFIENFNRGVYQPKLLFEDNAIIKRIKEHPLTATAVLIFYKQNRFSLLPVPQN
jgi:hypothetical protein